MRTAWLAFFLAGSLWAPPLHADELEELERATVARPDDGRAYDAYALAAFKQQKWDDAIRHLKIGVARIPDYAEGYYKLAYAYRQKREWADAADYYRRYIALQPQKSDPWFGLAASLQGLGDRKGAVAAYQKYITVEKAPEKARFVASAKAELAKLDPQGQLAPAEPPKKKSDEVAPVAVENAAPKAPKAEPKVTAETRVTAAQLRQAAELAKREGKLEQAAEGYELALKADASSAEMWNELGTIQVALKRYSDAQRSFRNATEHDRGLAIAWYNLAHALRKSEKKADAVLAYRQYMKLKPEDPDPYYGLGQTLKALGDVPGAIDSFKKYIGMERRPEEQKWVDKAKVELEALEALDRPRQPEGRRKRVSGTHLAELAEPFSPSRDLRNPFEGSTTRRPARELREFNHPRVVLAGELRDPFQGATLAASSDEPAARPVKHKRARRNEGDR